MILKGNNYFKIKNSNHFHKNFDSEYVLKSQTTDFEVKCPLDSAKVIMNIVNFMAEK